MHWQGIDWQTKISAIIIFGGAVIMLIGILKMKELFKSTPFIAERSQRFIVRFLQVNRFLMIFFLFGYLVVAFSFLMGFAIIGKFFVSFVFFLGAIFVFLGIVLHTRMLAEIQSTIQGLLPICLECKKIRLEGADSGDQKSWKDIESYISQRTDAKFSHGICPACLEKLRRKKH